MSPASHVLLTKAELQPVARNNVTNKHVGMEAICPPASESEVEQFEKNSGIQLPPCYRHYLLLSNGGQPFFEVVFQAGEGANALYSDDLIAFAMTSLGSI